MNTQKQLNTLNKLTISLFVVIALSIIALVAVNLAKANNTKQSVQIKESYSFHIENLISFEELEDCVLFQYAINDSTVTEVYTSVIEGDYLKTYADLYEYYKYYKDDEKMDETQSYILNNSHLEYTSNKYYKGWIWYYDACPIYLMDNTIK